MNTEFVLRLSHQPDDLWVRVGYFAQDKPRRPNAVVTKEIEESFDIGHHGLGRGNNAVPKQQQNTVVPVLDVHGERMDKHSCRGCVV